MFARIVTLVLLLGCSVAYADDVAAKREAIRSMLKAVTIRLMGAIVGYCRSEDTASAGAIERGYENYRAVMEKAVDESVDEIPESRLDTIITLNKSADISEKLDNVAEMMVGALRTQDASKYCPRIAGQLARYSLADAAQDIRKGRAMIEAARARSGTQSP